MTITKIYKINFISIFILIGLKIFDIVYTYIWIHELGIWLEGNPIGQIALSNPFLFVIFPLLLILSLLFLNILLKEDLFILKFLFVIIWILNVFYIIVINNNISIITRITITQ